MKAPDERTREVERFGNKGRLPMKVCSAAKELYNIVAYVLDRDVAKQWAKDAGFDEEETETILALMDRRVDDMNERV